jgi:hypothetical protein
MKTNELMAELAALRAKRKPVPTDEEVRAQAAVDALRAEIAAERRALRAEENDAIVAAHAPTKTRRFFDFDPDGEQPETIEYDKKTCALYTRFVVRGATADQLEKHSDAFVVKGVDGAGRPDVAIDAAKLQAVSIECAETCVVYPTAATAGVSAEQHMLNVKASLWHLGAARAEVGQAAIKLGGVDAAVHRSKS